MTNDFSKVSEWVKAGAMKTGTYLFERPVKETEKALAFEGERVSPCGFLKKALIWLPKSKLVRLENDFYTNNAPAEMFAVPAWLVAAKKRDGFHLI